MAIIGPGITIGPGIVFTTPPAPSIVSSGLVLNYATAPSSGSTWTDASGNGYNGTISAQGTGTATYTAGNSGGIVMTGSTGNNGAIVYNSYNLTNTWTVEMVMSISASNYWASLWGNEVYNSTLGYLAYLSSSTQLNVGSTNRVNTYTVSGLSSIKHYMFVVDATPSLKLYINGVLQTATSTGYTLAPTVSTNGFQFGSRHPNAGTANTVNDPCPGTYYQMRIYSRALSQDEVTQNFDAIKGTYGL